MEKNQTDSILEYGTVETENKKGKIKCLNIIGTIEGHNLLPDNVKTTKYEHVLPELVEVEEDESIDGLLILLNTVGGDVEAGLAMAEMIAGMKKPTASVVLGGSHSIGVPLAVSTKKSFIVPSATMTIHPLRINGLVISVMQTFKYLNKMQDRIIEFVVRNSKITYEDYKHLMLETDEIANDVGTVLFGEQAVNIGLIDQVGGVGDALSSLYKMFSEKS